jgi:hypothetical protein
MSNKPIQDRPGLVAPKDYKLNILSGNWVFCPDPKVINPLTGRCVSADSKTLSKKVAVIESVIGEVPVIAKAKASIKTIKTKKPVSTKAAKTIMAKIIEDYMVAASKGKGLTRSMSQSKMGSKKRTTRRGTI